MYKTVFKACFYYQYLLKVICLEFNYHKIIIIFSATKANPVKIITNLFCSNNPILILLFFWAITISTFKISNNNITLLIISDVVNICTAGMVEYTKYRFPLHLSGVVPETFLYTPKQKGGITTHITSVKSRVSAVAY